MLVNDRYKVNKRLSINDFIPKDLKAAEKKKIKSYVKRCALVYQIAGEEIPSVIDNEQNAQVIQYYDFELEDITKASFIANIYQNAIKSPCVLRLYDIEKEVYSFALKRLSQSDNTQIVVTDTMISKCYSISIPTHDKAEFIDTISFDYIINKQSKVSYYQEMYVKAYMMSKDKVYANNKQYLQRKDIWYSESKLKEIFTLLKTLESTKSKLLKISGNAEKIKLNKEIRAIIERLNKVCDEEGR